jgi:hypothetical protein
VSMVDDDRKAKKAARKAAKQAGAGAEAGKKKNPVIKEARRDYTRELRKQGLTEEQMKEKVRSHMHDVVKPAMTEAKAGAESQNLKGPERKKFIEDSVRSKLGIKAGQPAEGGRGRGK